MKFHWNVCLILSLWLIGASASALAGPPYNVEDAQTTEPNHIELNIGMCSNQACGSETQAVPNLDLGYGYTNNLAFALNLGGVSARTSGARRAVGFGDIETGVKWRFREETRRLPQFALEYGLKIPTASRSCGLGTGNFDHTLLLTASKSFGRSTFFGNIGGNFLGDCNSHNNLLYGLAYTVQLTEHLNIGAELYGNTSAASGERDELAWGVGATYNFAPDRVLLLKVGRSVQGFSDLNIYAGVQFIFGTRGGKSKK